MELEEAFGIMGEYALDLHTGQKCLGIELAENEAAALSKRIPSTITKNHLIERRETHILIPPFPVSILDLLNRFPDFFVCTSKDVAWFRKKPFAREIIPKRWQLIRKNILPASVGRKYSDQQSLIPRNEANVCANQIVYLICAWFLARQEILFQEHEVRCLDLVEVGGEKYHVIVRALGKDALKIMITYLGDKPYPNLGITTEFFPSPDS